MEQYLELSLLFDYYGCLLTEMQQSICDMYYNQNLSLTEISEDLGITKQGVRDALKKSEKLLYKYENALHLKEKNEKIGCLVQQIEETANRAGISEKDRETIKDAAERINGLI